MSLYSLTKTHPRTLTPSSSRKLHLILGATLAALMTSIPSATVAAEYKIGLLVGGSIASNEDNSETANLVFGGTPATFTNTYKVDQKSGFLAGLTAGVETEHGFTFEGEAAYRQSTFNTPGTLTANVGGLVESLPVAGEGSLSGYSFMANSWYDFQNAGSKKLRPFIGGGIGVAVKKSSGELRSLGTLFGFSVSNSTGLGNKQETGFAWQLGAGLKTDLSNNMTASLSYRYFDGGKINGEFDFAMHSIVLGISF